MQCQVSKTSSKSYNYFFCLSLCILAMKLHHVSYHLSPTLRAVEGEGEREEVVV